MATETAPKQTDTKPPTTTQAKTKSKPRAKTAAKSRTAQHAVDVAQPHRLEVAHAQARGPHHPHRDRDGDRPRTQAKALNGGQQFVAGVIDAQERTVTAIVDYQTRAAELSQIPGATAIAGAQAQVLRGVTDAYVSAARAFLK